MHSIVLQRVFFLRSLSVNNIEWGRKQIAIFFLSGMFIVCYDLAYPTWKGLNNNGYSATTREPQGNVTN